jgi:hypothetical protein
VKWHLKSVVAVSVLSAWVTLPSCTPKIDSGTYLQQEASEIRQRSLPPDSRLVTQRPLALQGLGASASWEFESNYAPDAYDRWVTSKLRPDFQVRETANSRLRFSKDAHGDVETLSMEMVSCTGTLHVAVKLEIYPD